MFMVSRVLSKMYNSEVISPNESLIFTIPKILVIRKHGSSRSAYYAWRAKGCFHVSVSSKLEKLSEVMNLYHYTL